MHRSQSNGGSSEGEDPKKTVIIKKRPEYWSVAFQTKCIFFFFFVTLLLNYRVLPELSFRIYLSILSLSLKMGYSLLVYCYSCANLDL